MTRHAQDYKEFHVIYVGAKARVENLKKDLGDMLRNTAQENLPHVFKVSWAFLNTLINLNREWPSVSLYFYSDIYQVARDLSKMNADLIIVDERDNHLEDTANLDIIDETLPENVLHLTHNSMQPIIGKSVCINFENLRAAIIQFTPKDFIFTMRRILVVLPVATKQTDREFYLGLANIRGILVNPKNSTELLGFIAKQLYDFRKNYNKTSICISGGGLDGYIYSIGVINALDDCFMKQNCTEFDIFCGVSSGALLSSSLACGIDSQSLVKQLYRRHPILEPITLGMVFDLATGEIIKRVFNLIYAVPTLDPGEIVTRLKSLIPIGVFRGEKLKKFFEKQIKMMGYVDNMSALKKELYISATDQDTGENIVFGEEPWKDIRISQAIRASTALPPFYLPERINGHWFTDGQLTSSSDFNTAIRKGAGLVVYIDPMVPYTSNMPGAILKRGGYFTTVQAVKSLVQTRSKSLLLHAMDNNPDVDFVIFQPADELMEAMAGNPMKYHIRTELLELGYKCTIRQIYKQYESFAHKFAKHGFDLKTQQEIQMMLT